MLGMPVALWSPCAFAVTSWGWSIGASAAVPRTERECSGEKVMDNMPEPPSPPSAALEGVASLGVAAPCTSGCGFAQQLRPLLARRRLLPPPPRW